MTDEIKAGRRNSASDQKLIDGICDAAIQLGAQHTRLLASDPGAAAMFDPEKALVHLGAEVKALGDGRVGGYLVRFSDADAPDLTGDYFAPECDFGEPAALPVLYHHGLDEDLKRRRIGTAQCKKDAVGLWVEAQLALRDDYEKAIYALAEAGKLGWSSGAAAHTVERAPEGKSARITQWYIAEASLTPTPAEPRNAAMSLKAYTALWSARVEQPASNGARTEAAVTDHPILEQEKPTMADEQKPSEMQQMADMLKGMLEHGLAEIKAEMKTAEPVKTGGVAGILEAQQAPAVKSAPKETAEQEAMIYFLKTLRGEMTAHEYARAVKATLAEGAASTGGALVPTGYSNQLVTTLGELSVVRNSGAKVLSIDGVNPFVVPTMTRTARAAASAMRLAEGGAYQQMEPTFSTVQFDPYKRGALYVASDETVQDTRIPLTQIIQESVGQQFADIENLELATGNGSSGSAGQPNGLVTAASISVSVGSSVLSTLTGENVISLYHALPWQYRARGVWYANDTVIQTIRKLRDGSGGAASLGNFLWQPGMQAGQPDRLLGRPLYTLNTMALSGASARILVFADPSYYWISDFAAGAAEFKQLNELYAASGLVGWRFTRRYDANLMVAEAAVALQLI